MATSLATLREKLSELIADWAKYTATTEIAANNNIISTALAEFSDDYFNNWYVLIISGNNSGVQRRIQDFAQSTTTLTVYGAVLTADAAGTYATFELHRIDPDDKKRQLNVVLRDVFPYLYKRLEDNSLVSNNLLPNSHFEDWSAGTTLPPDNYARSGASLPAVARETAIIRGADLSMQLASMKLSGATNEFVYISEVEWPRLLALENNSVTFRCWVRSDTAAATRLRIRTITQAGVTWGAYSSSHTGGGEFELLEIKDMNIPDNLAKIRLDFIPGSGATTYFDNARVVATCYEYKLGTSWSEKPYDVWMQVSGDCDNIGGSFRWQRLHNWIYRDDGSDKWLILRTNISGERILKLMGITYLTELTTDASTTELDEPYVRLLLVQAMVSLFRSQGYKITAEDTARYDAEYRRWMGELALARRQHYMPVTPSAMKSPYW